MPAPALDVLMCDVLSLLCVALCSAVDAHVGASIFANAICKLLAGKTRVLVTHGLQYITHADQIFVMDGGRIVEQVSCRAHRLPTIGVATAQLL
jgi:ABC-type bacteriocin/lantibiotic exporter with double-glycine peptidase domain